MTDPQPETAQIQLLGEVRVAAGSGTTPVRGLPGLLLCVFALHLDQVLSTDRLADEIWRDDQPKDPGNALHRLIRRLRHQLPEPVADRLVTRRPGYTLRLSRQDVDIERFADLVDDGRRLLATGAAAVAGVKLAEARRLVRGAPFGGRDHDAVHTARARVDELVLTCDELAVEAALGVGDHHTALERLRPLLARHPLHERFVAQLMLAHYRAGRQSDALDAYRAARSALVNELGVEPGPELAGLHAAILGHDPALIAPAPPPAPPPAPGRQPAPATFSLPLLGREDVMAVLRDAWRLATDGRQVLVQLTGESGSGRSRLLAEFAAQLPADDVVLATAHPADRADPSGLFGRLRRHSRPWPTAVIVDDADVADATSLTELARAHAAAPSSLLVWSHRTEVGLPAQPLHRLVQAAAKTGEVVRLPLSRLNAVDVAGAFADGTDPAVPVALVRASGGVARELHAMVSRLLADGTLAVTGGRLAAVTALPPLGDLDPAPPGQATDAEVLAVLAVAGRPVPVRVLAGALDLDDAGLLARIAPAIEHGAVAEGPRGLTVGAAVDNGRVIARLGDAQKTAALLRLADAWSRGGAGPADAAAVGGYYLSAGATEQARPLLTEAALRAAAAGTPHEALALVEAALGIDQGGRPDAERGRLLLMRAEGRVFSGPLQAALDDAVAAVGLLADAERRRARVVAAEIAMSLRRHDLVDELVHAATTHSPAGPDGHLGELLSIHAVTLSERQRHADAEATGASAIAQVDEADDLRARAHTHLNLGWMALERGEGRVARRRLVTALDSGRLDGTDHEVTARLFLSRAQFLTGEADAALIQHRRATHRVQAEGLTGMAALASGTFALGLLVFGRCRDALGAADQMLALSVHASPVHEIAARTRRAQALSGCGKHDEAAEEIATALDLCPTGPEARRQRLAIRAIAARIASAAESPWPAAELADLVARLEASGRPLSAVETLTALAVSHHDGDAAERALTVAIELGVPMHAAQAAQAGALWSSPAGAAAREAVRSIRRHLPAEWQDDWHARPEVAAALSAPG